MKLVDKHITDLVSGYDAILQAEIELRQRWRPHLLKAYARRQQIYQQQQARQKRWRNLPMIGVFGGMSILLLGGAISCSDFAIDDLDRLLVCCGGPLLMLLGLLILGAIGLSRFSQDAKKQMRAPLHPLRGQVIPDIRTAWLQGLSGGLKEEIPDYPGYYAVGEKDYGAEGERLFIRCLLENFDDRYYVLARVMQHRREDVDVILIGPKGVWVFEVKHWSGEVIWNDQGWQRVQIYYERGGAQVTKQPDVGEPPNQQWGRVASEVLRTLQYRAPDVLAAHPGMNKVRGGIVFSKEDVQLKIQPGRPVFWGSLNFWIDTLLDVEPKAELDTRSTLQLVAALLARHQELTPDGRKRSMQVYAQDVVQDADERLTEWVQV